jgi:iron complex outermembrane receptor protein
MNARASAAGAWLLISIAASPVWCQPAEPTEAVSLAANAQSADPYFEALPVVLSVTHLRQSLADAPAAVTVIDSDFIRRSGARDINELFRLVPGFQVGSNNGAHPLLYYHGVFDEFSRRLQVLVDGRSVYLPILLGEVEWNAVAVALEDIERIEVIRGSNSASFGDVAFHGMLNIITRHASTSSGATLATNVGNDGIQDGFARISWGREGANYRFSMKDQRDRGLTNAFDDRHMSLANFRADLNPTARDELTISAGASRADAGQGYVGKLENPAHTQQFSSDFLQMNWLRELGGELGTAASLRVSASHADEDYIDQVTYRLPSNPTYDFSGRGSRDTLSAQHTFSPSENWRLVWGGELQQDRVKSRSLGNSGTNTVNRLQCFANAEWRAAPWLLINAGGLQEHDSLSGSRFAPRLVGNFQISDTQTIRAGISKAFRPPSIMERTGDLRLWSGDNPLRSLALGNGNFQSEWLLTRELSYLGDIPDLRLRLDVRAFHEQISGLMRLELNGDGVAVVSNGSDVSERGVEYQADWRPLEGTRLLLAQTFMRISSSKPDTFFSAPTLSAPTHNSSIGWFQDLPGDFQLSLMRYAWGSMAWQGIHNQLDAHVRTDLRIAHSLRTAGTRGEIALVIQNLNHPYTDFVPDFLYERRAFVSLRLDF